MKAKTKKKGGFYNIFCKKKTKYFGGWYVKCKEKEIEEYFKNKQEIERVFMRLFMYLESAEILKKQAKKKKWSISQIYSKQLWYHVVLLLLIGIIDKYTKGETRVDDKGKIVPKRLEKRFQIIMKNLKEGEKRDVLNHYFNNKKKFKSYEEAINHLYQSRTFFAHDFEQVDNNTPDDTSLSFSESKEHGYVIHFNLPYGKIFLYIIVALVRYLQFSGNISVSTSKSYNTWSDFGSDEA